MRAEGYRVGRGPGSIRRDLFSVIPARGPKRVYARLRRAMAREPGIHSLQCCGVWIPGPLASSRNDSKRRRLDIITDPLFYALAVPAVLALGLSKGGFAGAGQAALP